MPSTDLESAAHWNMYYNTADASDAGRFAMLSERFAEVGEGTVIRAPFHCDFGGNIFLGERVFLNFGCVILDVAPVRIGTGTAIGPGVQILASDHPRDPDLRRQGMRYGKPVTICENVWIGGGAIILPGVTIGDDAIVGAGSIVTRDVLPGTTVVGNPARAHGALEATN